MGRCSCGGQRQRCVMLGPKTKWCRQRQRRRSSLVPAYALLLILILGLHRSPSATAAPGTNTATITDTDASKEDIKKAEEESYSSYLWRRAEAIWEAATGELPPPRQSASSSDGTLLLPHPQHAKADETTAASNVEEQALAGVDLGRHLLHEKGDATGAELICLEELNGVSKHDHNQQQTDVQSARLAALTCLGEAQLALHQSSYAKAQSARSGSVTRGLYLSQSLDKLHAASDTLQEAVLLDPTQAQSRLGVGLAMMLTATRRGENEDNEEAEEEAKVSKARMLFGAVQHFEAAVRMTQSSAAAASSSSSSPPLHLASLHNLALAHLALGDAASAIGPLQSVATILHQSSSSTSALGAHEEANLGSAMIQAGMMDEGVQILVDLESRYCQSGDLKRSKMSSLCSIVYNNLGIAHEIKRSTNEGDIEDDVRTGVMLSESAANGTSSAEEYYDLSIAVEPNSINLYNRDACAETNSIKDETLGAEWGDGADSLDSDFQQQQLGSINHWKVAIEALEAIVDQNPDNSRSWVSLSKARTRAGNHAGAMEAAARGVSTAQGKDELDLANSALDDALSGLASVATDASGGEAALAHPKPMYSDEASSPAEVRALRLEQEVLSLKFQLLEQRVGGNFAPPRYADHRHDAWGASYMDEERGRQPDHVPLEGSSISMPSASNSQSSTADDIPPKEDHQDESTQEEGMSDDPTSAEEVTSTKEDAVAEKEPASEEEYATELGDESHDGDPEVVEDEDKARDGTHHHVGVYGSGNDEGLEIGEEKSIGEADDVVVEDIETVSAQQKPKVETQTDREKTKDDDQVEEEEAEPEISLPELYNPTRSPPPELPAIVPSYMKLADAYMQKEDYANAQKKFKQVLKKAPQHIPAILGYATAIERSGNPKKTLEAALTYGNATKAALDIGDERLGTIALRRATALCQGAAVTSKDRLDALRKLSEIAFTGELAADIYFAIGLDIVASDKEGESETQEAEIPEEAMNAFKIANRFACIGQDASAECYGHGGSLSKLARLTLKKDANEALRYASLALKSGVDDETKIDAHVIAGQAKMLLGDSEGAIADYHGALDLHVGQATGEAHHHLALTLQRTGGEADAIVNHFEQSLHLGFPPSREAIDALGEDSLAVRRAINRQQWAEYERAQQQQYGGGGGILGGGASSLDSGGSVFASSQQQEDTGPSQLDILAEGAAAYDGSSVPTGEESGEGGEGGLSPGLSGQGAASSRARA